MAQERGRLPPPQAGCGRPSRPCLESAEKPELISRAPRPPSPPIPSQPGAGSGGRKAGPVFTALFALGGREAQPGASFHTPTPMREQNICLESGGSLSSHLVPGKHSHERLWLWPPREVTLPASWGAGPPSWGPGHPSPCHSPAWSRAEGDQGSRGLSGHRQTHWTRWRKTVKTSVASPRGGGSWVPTSEPGPCTL